VEKNRSFKLVHFIVGPVVFRVIMFLFLANTGADSGGGGAGGGIRGGGHLRPGHAKDLQQNPG